MAFGHIVSADLNWDFIYQPIKGEELNWYFGLGPYLTVIENKDYESGTCEAENDFSICIAYELCIEYRFVEFPLAMGFDYRPNLEIYDQTSLQWGGFGFNVRYVFNRK